MIEEINYFGYWFLPGKEDEKKSGSLRFSPSSNIELEIFGMFGDFLLGPDHFLIILGETNGGLITLVDIRYRRRNSKHSRYQSTFMFVGKHFKSTEEIKFDICFVDLFGLNALIKTKSLDFIDIDSVRNWEVKYKAPEVISFEVPNRYKGELKCEGIRSLKYPSKVRIKETIYIKFNYTDRSNFKDILLDIGKLRGFVSLLNDETSFPEKILLRNIDEDESVELIHKNIFYQEQPNSRINSIITIEELENFEKIIEKWHEFYSEIEHVFNLRLYHYRDKNFFSIDRFIDMTRVLESFHRLKRNNYRMPPARYEEFVQKMKEVSLEKEFKLLLNDRLNYGNEPTFKMRLIEIFSEIPTSIMDLIDKDKDLAKVIKDTRNYYTHYGAELREKTPSTNELIAITNNLESIISFILLKECGVNEDLLKTNFTHRGLFKKWKYRT